MKVFFDTNVYVAEATDFHSAMSLDVGRKKKLVLPALGAERGKHGRQAAIIRPHPAYTPRLPPQEVGCNGFWVW